jgi:glycosyltransferase involved in cell wall biosynthesis
MTITALVHTKNEAGNLADCLDSLRWADELVVADMSSTDNTRDIAVARGARVIDVPTVPLVDRVRNQALAECRGDWILVVDADERVPPKLAERLRHTASSSGAATAYGLPRRNYFLGCWLECGFWPDYQIRFFRRGAASWSEMVHEPPRIQGNLDHFPADPGAALEHPGYGNDLSRFISKMANYSALDAERLEATIKPPIWPFLIRRPLGEFYGRYVLESAWRHGMHGLVWSLLMANYQLLVAVHYWNRVRDTRPPSSDWLRKKVRLEALRAGAKWLWPRP